ncbi:MAG: hypothetical protein JO047_01340 [Alphaproteobacteria bacterium]|nr:hypothetical protein [Alphaproteobacteria bacterium]
MTGLTKRLQDALRQAESWPEEIQAELADAANEIAAGLNGDYPPSRDELTGIDCGIADAERGRFATEEQVKTAWARFRQP